jgi:hypothetical protein
MITVNFYVQAKKVALRPIFYLGAAYRFALRHAVSPRIASHVGRANLYDVTRRTYLG